MDSPRSPLPVLARPHEAKACAGRTSALCALLLTSGAWLGAPPRARAEGRWLVIEVSNGAPSATAPVTIEHVVERLRDRGQDVVDAQSAAIDVERKHSHSPVRLQSDEVEKLDDALHTLADYLASENLPEARSALAEVEQLTPEARDYLNRQLNRARRRFHTCLLAAHLFAKEGYDDDAFEQVRKCARDFPGFEPEESPYMPASIRAFFARARDELAAIPPATLHVESESVSDPSCRVRVNGIDKGPPPATVPDVHAEEVRVQIDCNRNSGRIYVEHVEPGADVIRIDPRLDRAIDTTGALALRYPDAHAANEQRVAHAVELARAIGVEHVVELVGESLHRIDSASQREIGAVDLDDAGLNDAVDRLLEARLGPGAAGGITAADTGNARPAPLYGLAWVGVGAAVVSGAVTVVAWRVREHAAHKFNRDECKDELDPSYEASACQDPYDTVKGAETAMWVSGIGAGVFMGVATVLFVLDANQSTSAPAARAARHCGPGPGQLGVSCGFSF